MMKLFRLQMLLFVFLFNCQDKKNIKCDLSKERVNFYMDKLTRLKQSVVYENHIVDKPILDGISKVQDSTYYYYKELIKCDSTDSNVIADFRSFLFLNNKRLESIQYGEKLLTSENVDEYVKDQIRRSNFYSMLIADSVMYKKQIHDYYIYSKTYPINQNLLKTKNDDYEKIIRNKILAIYYFEGYDAAIKLLSENNFDYKFTDLWQNIEQFQPLDIYRRMYDFDKPTYYPMKDIEKSKNYKEFYKSLTKFVEQKKLHKNL